MTDKLYIFFSVLAMVVAEAALYMGLVSKLSNIHNSLEPCTDRCLQFKVMGDHSLVPNTGVWPFAVRNGEARNTTIMACEAVGAYYCDSMPALSCPEVTAESCERRRVQHRAHNPLKGSGTEYMFLLCTLAHSLCKLVNDAGLQLDALADIDALFFQILSTVAMCAMSAFALTWASGAMELFLTLEHEVAGQPCGCLYRMQDFPALFALALPITLVARSRTTLVNTMRAVVVSKSFLSSTKYYVTYDHIREAKIKPMGSLVGVRSMGPYASRSDAGGAADREDSREVALVPGDGRGPAAFLSEESVKRMAKYLPLIVVACIMFPLLFTSGTLIYRLADLAVMSWNTVGPFKIDYVRPGSLAMLGVFGMMILQVGVVKLIIGETHALNGILNVQLKPEGHALHVKQELAEDGHPELAWAFAPTLPDLAAKEGKATG